MVALPRPLSGFVEHDVAADVDAPSAGVVDPVGRGTRLVSHEDHAPAPVVELALVRRGHFDVSDAPERAQVMNGRRRAIQVLVRRASTQPLRRGTVEDVDRSGDGLPPEHARQLLGLQHTAGHAHNHLIAALDNAVLLRGMGRREFTPDPQLGAVLVEVRRSEFAAPVRAKSTELLARLAFGRGLHALDGGGRGIFGWQQADPHVT